MSFDSAAQVMDSPELVHYIIERFVETGIFFLAPWWRVRPFNEIKKTKNILTFVSQKITGSFGEVGGSSAEIISNPEPERRRDADQLDENPYPRRPEQKSEILPAFLFDELGYQ